MVIRESESASSIILNSSSAGRLSNRAIMAIFDVEGDEGCLQLQKAGESREPDPFSPHAFLSRVASSSAFCINLRLRRCTAVVFEVNASM